MSFNPKVFAQSTMPAQSQALLLVKLVSERALFLEDSINENPSVEQTKFLHLPFKLKFFQTHWQLLYSKNP